MRIWRRRSISSASSSSIIGYGIGCEYFWKGQTLGKWMLGLRVMDMTGLELQFSQVVIRNLLRIFDQLPAWGLVGGVAMLASKHRQRLGDLAAGTVVIRDRRPEPKRSEWLGARPLQFVSAASDTLRACTKAGAPGGWRDCGGGAHAARFAG